jgi:hypothetical protein
MMNAMSGINQGVALRWYALPCWGKATQNGAQQATEATLVERQCSFASLSPEDQKIAEIFLHEIFLHDIQ